MKGHGAAGFTLVELLLAAALLCVVAGVLFRLVIVAQAAVVSQGALADVQQRLRVAAAALQDDLLMAGAGPSQGPVRGPLTAVLPAVRPSRTGERNPDPEIFFASDRITLLYVPESASQSALSADVAGPGAPLVLDPGWPGCPQDGSCGFSPGDRALVFDPSGSGAYDIFTVQSAVGGLVTRPAGSSWSHAYPRGSPVVAVTQRVYYLDRRTSSLMVYDGGQSSGPLIDHVVDVRFSYYAGPASGPLAAAELTGEPVTGVAPNRFDADLLRVRRVRVAITVESPVVIPGLNGRQRRRITFDVTPRNLGGEP